MTVFSKSVAAAFTALVLAPITVSAQGSIQLLDMFAEQGFTMSEVHSLAVMLDYQGELQQLPTGEQFGIYNTQDGRTFIVKPDFCETGTCLGLVFASYYPANQFSATYQQLNDFNVIRPHGNAVYVAGASSFAVQRVIFNISGVTYGAIAGEFGVFEGYSRSFDIYVRGLTGAANVAYKDDADDAKTSKTLNDGFDGTVPTADNYFAPSNAAHEILIDRIANGSVKEIYYRPVTE